VQFPRWRRNPRCCAALHSFTNNLHVAFISYLFDNLGFLLSDNSLLYASYLPLGVPNGRVLYRHKKLLPGTAAIPVTRKQQTFLAPLPGRSRHAARGVSHTQSLYFVYCLALNGGFFIVARVFARKITFISRSCFLSFDKENI
jgi:hypothetical protein